MMGAAAVSSFLNLIRIAPFATQPLTGRRRPGPGALTGARE
jgi:hypothetical protein